MERKETKLSCYYIIRTHVHTALWRFRSLISNQFKLHGSDLHGSDDKLPSLLNDTQQTKEAVFDLVRFSSD